MPCTNYAQLLEPLPEGAKFERRPTSLTHIAHVFTAQREELSRRLRHLRDRLSPEAIIWVSWPKKASKIPTTVTEDTIRDLAFPLHLVDVKVCAVTEVWSGLKLVVRKDLRIAQMLELRPNCECCDRDLPPDSVDARICSFECTFCAPCADTKLGGTCPNCGGEMVSRPRRPAAMLATRPGSTQRVYNPKGCNSGG